MVRRCETFLARDAPASPSAATVAVGGEELQSRAGRLLEELGAVLQDGSAMWDVRIITTALEYCNCLWTQIVQGEEGGRAGSQARRATPGAGVGPLEEENDDSSQVEGRASTSAHSPAWVALKVLLQPPFHYTLANVVGFYSAMLEQLGAWLRELQRMLPADPTRRRPYLSEDDMYVHLSEVLLTVLERWTDQVDASRADQRAGEAFASSWGSTERVLRAMRQRLGDVAGEAHAAAPRLQKEVQRLEDRGRRLAARAGQLEAPANPPPLTTLPTPSAEKAIGGASKLGGLPGLTLLGGGAAGGSTSGTAA